MPPFEPQKKSSSSVYMIVAVVVLIVTALMAYGYKSQENSPQPKQQPTTQTVPVTKTKENVTVKSTNLSSVKESKVPAGFPSYITIEPSAVFTQSYKAVFPDRKVTQYTVAFTTKNSVSASADTYKAMLKNNGYTVTVGEDTATTKSFYGKKDNNDLSVTISKDPAGSSVVISYLDRQ